jgi:hypothetical protein
LFSFGVPVVMADYLRQETIYLQKRHHARNRNISKHIRQALSDLFPHTHKRTAVPLEHLQNLLVSLYQPTVDSIMPHNRESDSIKIREFKSKKGSLNILQNQ